MSDRQGKEKNDEGKEFSYVTSDQIYHQVKRTGTVHRTIERHVIHNHSLTQSVEEDREEYKKNVGQTKRKVSLKPKVGKERAIVHQKKKQSDQKCSKL